MRLIALSLFALSCFARWADIAIGGKTYTVDLSSPDVVSALRPADPVQAVPAWLRPFPNAVPASVRHDGGQVTATYRVAGDPKGIAEFYRGAAERQGLDVLLRPWGANAYQLSASDGANSPILRVSTGSDRQGIWLRIEYGLSRQSRRALGMPGTGMDLEFVRFEPTSGEALLRDHVGKQYFYLRRYVIESQNVAGRPGGAATMSYQAWMPMYRAAQLEGNMQQERMWNGEDDWEPVVTLIGQPGDGARAFAFYRQNLSTVAILRGAQPMRGGGILQGYAPDGKSRFKVVVSCPNPGDPAMVEIYVAQLLPEHWVQARR